MGDTSNAADEPEFVTLAEVADRLRVDPRTVRHLVDSGQLQAVRVGPRSLRIAAAAVDEFTHQQKAA